MGRGFQPSAWRSGSSPSGILLPILQLVSAFGLQKKDFEFVSVVSYPLDTRAKKENFDVYHLNQWYGSGPDRKLRRIEGRQSKMSSNKIYLYIDFVAGVYQSL
jgi:hypothetical protein